MKLCTPDIMQFKCIKCIKQASVLMFSYCCKLIFYLGLIIKDEMLCASEPLSCCRCKPRKMMQSKLLILTFDIVDTG